MAQETSFGDDSAVGPRFERFKFAEDEINKKKRIVFIDKKVLKDRVHYKDGYGYMRCLQPEGCPACMNGMNGNDRFGTVVLEYYTDMDGNVSKPFGYSVKAFVFGNGKGNGTYSLLHGFYKALGDKMYSRDFIVSCSNPKYQTLTFIPLETCHLLDMAKSNPEGFAEVKADYRQKMSDMDILRVIAPSVTADIMQQVVEGKIVRRSTKNQPAATTAAPTAVAPAVGVQPVTNFAEAAGVARAQAPATTAPAAESKVDEAKKMMDELAQL
jgi:hypothetical protein